MKPSVQAAEVTKTFKRVMPNTWWMKRASYFWFMVRELSSVFVALYAIFLILQVRAVAHGADSYNAWSSVFHSGGMMLLHGIMLLLILYHMVTWFRISGRIFGFGSLTPGGVVAANYILWAVVTVAVIFLITR